MGVDKTTLRIGDVTLLQHAVATLSTVASPVLVSSGSAAIDGYGCVLDETGGRGPLSGIVAGLRESPHELLAVVAVDMPALDPSLLRALALLRTDEDAVLPLSDGGVEPLHAVYARSALRALRAALASEQHSVRAALGSLRTLQVDARSLGAASEFARNLNTPDELKRWMERRRGGAAPQR